MATEEIEISQLELAEEILADMVTPVETATETKAITLSQLRKWLGSSLPTGFILPAVGRIEDSRFTLLDGKTLSRTGTYEAFCNKVIEQVNAGNWFSCTQSEYDEELSNYGQCGRFVIETDYVRIPTITRYIGATITLSEIGKTYAESLPNITGSFEANSRDNSNCTSAFNKGSSRYNVSSDVSIKGCWNISFDASRSSSTYQDNAKVNPENTKYPYYMVISTTGQTAEVEIDINNVYEDLNLKANKDLSDVSQEGKERVVGWGIPDYSAGVAVVVGSASNPNRFNKDGILYFSQIITSDKYIYIEKTPYSGQYAQIYITDGTSNGRFLQTIVIPKDCGFYFTDLSTQYYDWGFFPLKGGQNA